MINEIINNQRNAYSETFQNYGATPQGTYQNNIETQNLRFERITKHILQYLNGCSIHDIGSGLCDFHNYLQLNDINHFYSGTEIVQEMIDYSLKKYNDIKLYNRDFLLVEKELYDFIVLSGTLNMTHGIDKKIWKKYCLNLIEKMFSMSSKGIVFNFLTSYNTFSQEDLIYFNPAKMLDFCIKKLSRFVVIDQSYPLYEVTITVLKKDFVKSIYKNECFDKYFKN